MDSSGNYDGDSQDTTLPSRPPTAQGSKRDQEAASIFDRSPPAKKQQTLPTAPAATPHSTVNEGLRFIIFLGCDRHGKPCQGPLDMFSDPNVHTPNRAVHHSYERFREWLEEALDIPLDATVLATVIDDTDQEVTQRISPRWEFMAMLVKLDAGFLRASYKETGGNIICIRQADSESDRAAEPEVEAEQATNIQDQAAASVEPGPQDVGVAEDDRQESQPAATLAADDSSLQDPSQPRVLTAPEFFSVVRRAYGPDDPILKPAMQDETEADNRLYKIDPVTFKKALRFFNTNLDDEQKCHIKGIKVTTQFWQVYTAYDMFMAPVSRGMSGFCIGLGVGYGKTILTLIYIQARAVLLDLWESVYKEWKHRKTANHLPRSNRDPNRACPSQHKHMILCPCVYRSDSKKVLRYLANSPVVIIIPPNLKSNWRDELGKALSDFDTAQQNLRFYYYFGEKTPGNDLSAAARKSDPDTHRQHIEDTTGMIEVNLDIETGESSKVLIPINGTAHDVFLISNCVVKQFFDLYWDPIEKMSRFTSGAVFMDEFHRYGGASDRGTIPFDRVKDMSDHANHPVMLFPLCGTLVEEGPGSWRAPTQHYISQWRKWGESEHAHERLLISTIGDPSTVLTGLDTIRKSHKTLVEGIATSSIQEDEVGALVGEIRPYMTLLIRALRKCQPWRGQVLNELPPCNHRSIKISDGQVSRDTASARDALVAQVQTLIDSELRRLKREWTDRKDLAEKRGVPFTEAAPTAHDIVEVQLQSYRDKTDGAWFSLGRASAYPRLAALLRDRKVLPEMFASQASQEIPVKVQNAILMKGTPREEAIQRFTSWDFRRYRRQLDRDSPKLQELRALIRRMVMDNDPATAPKDGSQRRHAIVYHTHSISAALSYYFLITDDDLCGKIEPLLLSSQVTGVTRQKVLSSITEDCSEDSRCKVLIAVVEIAAEGFNFQRVNNIWFMELPPTLTKFLQAVGRAHRSGQTMRVNVVKMFDETNLLEKFGYETLNSKQMVAEKLYNVQETGTVYE